MLDQTPAGVAGGPDTPARRAPSPAPADCDDLRLLVHRTFGDGPLPGTPRLAAPGDDPDRS